MPRNVFDDILGTIGQTPLVRLNRIARDIPATVYAKVETFNPGHSIKDRMALRMIEDAERRGDLKPGATHKIGEEVGLPGRVGGWIAQAKAFTAEAE